MHRLRGVIAAVSLAVPLTGCSDGLSLGACRTIAQSFCLERWEDGVTYYLNGPIERDGGGFIAGTVTAIGWNDQFILAKRYANFRGDGDGWMLININRGTMVGPLTDAEIEKDDRVRTIATLGPESAWKSLGHF